MQKIINLMALASFGVSVVVVAGGVYVYQNKDAMIDNIKQNIIKGATESITGSLPGLMGGTSTDPLPSSGGGLPPVTLPF